MWRSFKGRLEGGEDDGARKSDLIFFPNEGSHRRGGGGEVGSGWHGQPLRNPEVAEDLSDRRHALGVDDVGDGRVASGGHRLQCGWSRVVLGCGRRVRSRGVRDNGDGALWGLGSVVIPIVRLEGGVAGATVAASSSPTATCASSEAAGAAPSVGPDPRRACWRSERHLPQGGHALPAPSPCLRRRSRQARHARPRVRQRKLPVTQPGHEGPLRRGRAHLGPRALRRSLPF